MGIHGTLLALLVLAVAPPSDARAIEYDPRLSGQGFRFSSPNLVDLDADGDMDVIGVDDLGDHHYVENVGTPSRGSYVERTGSENPLGSFFIPEGVATTVGDFDGDGDLDVLTGDPYDEVHFFENVGTPQDAAFEKRAQELALCHAFSDLGQENAYAPVLVDLDDDGDLDLVTGRLGGAPPSAPREVCYAENVGTPTAPSFQVRVGGDSPFPALPAPPFDAVRPVLVDGDGDGDLDLLLGDSWLENVGDASNPEFVEGAAQTHPVPEAATSLVSGSAGDVDGDGNLDLLVGPLVLLKDLGAPGAPAFELNTAPFTGFDAGSESMPALADLDGDGDLDAVSGRQDGGFAYLENVGSPASPSFTERTGASNPFDGLDVGDESTPALADFDADGDFDLVSGSAAGTFHPFENQGTAASPSFVSSVLPGLAAAIQRSAPSFGDADGDGDLDAISGNGEASLVYFENVGTPEVAAFVQQVGLGNPFDGVDLDASQTSRTRSIPTWTDLDGDGDLDVVAYASDGGGDRIFFLENVGTASVPSIVLQDGASDPFARFSKGLGPALADLDADGLPDLVLGRSEGQLYRYAPEPGALASLGAGLACALGLAGWRRARGESVGARKPS